MVLKIRSKKAQAWSLDVVVAIVIFMAGVIILYVYAINYVNQGGQQLDDLLYQGNTAAELLLGDDELGLVSNGKINQDKLNDFYASDYKLKKMRLGVKDDFYFILQNLEVNGTLVGYAGLMNSTAVKNSIKVSRFSVYKNKPIKFQIYVWRN
ncbi:hypothetical protein J4225_02790 [Candidatus Pacearchaeota archaeon]|nr:hypothetical protein [Candidatus Pacearchaeota archaeon]